MRRRTFAILLALSTSPTLATDASGAASPWHVPPCAGVTGTKSVAITSDEGATLVTAGHRLRPTSYAFGLAVLPDVPNTMLLAHDRTLLRSTTAGCRWDTVGTIDSPSDSFPVSLVPARGDRAFAWADNRNDLARIDGVAITYLTSPVASIVGLGTDPADPDRVRIGSSDGQVWEAVDGGNRFSTVGAPVPGFLYRAAFDPSNLDHAVAGVIADGAYVTFDGGRTWTRATGLSSTGTGGVNVFSVVVSPADPMTVFAMGLDFEQADGRHIYLSRDGGLTFHPVVDPSIDVVLTNGVPMAAHPTNPDVVYFSYGTSFAGYGADLYRYDDSTGKVTKTHNTYHGLPSIAFNPADPTTMYLGLALESVN